MTQYKFVTYGSGERQEETVTDDKLALNILDALDRYKIDHRFYKDDKLIQEKDHNNPYRTYYGPK